MIFGLIQLLICFGLIEQMRIEKERVPEQHFDCIASPRLEKFVGLNTARLVIDTDVLIRWMDGGRHSLHFHCLPSIPSAQICLLLILFCKHFCTGLGGAYW